MYQAQRLVPDAIFHLPFYLPQCVFVMKILLQLTPEGRRDSYRCRRKPKTESPAIKQPYKQVIDPGFELKSDFAIGKVVMLERLPNNFAAVEPGLHLAEFARIGTKCPCDRAGDRNDDLAVQIK